MKKFLSFLSDPYLHMIGIGILILSLSSFAGEAEQKSLVSEAPECPICHKFHEDAFGCAHLVANTRPAEQLPN